MLANNVFLLNQESSNIAHALVAQGFVGPSSPVGGWSMANSGFPVPRADFASPCGPALSSLQPYSCAFLHVGFKALLLPLRPLISSFQRYFGVGLLDSEALTGRQGKARSETIGRLSSLMFNVVREVSCSSSHSSIWLPKPLLCHFGPSTSFSRC